MKTKDPISRIELAAIRSLARQIARDLFTDGRGKVAERMQMMHGPTDNEKPGGGLCEGAVVDRIEAHLISWPKIGQRVQIWYRAERAPHMPWHGRIGVIEIAGRSRPRNHLVNIDGTTVVVPAGNLRNPKDGR